MPIHPIGFVAPNGETTTPPPIGPGGPPPSWATSGLVAFWRMNDLTDASGNGNTLTTQGSPSFVLGKVNGGGAAVVNATNYLKSSAQIGGGGTGWTISLWLNPSESASSNRMFVADASYANLYFMRYGSRIYFNVKNTGQRQSTSTIPQNAWTHTVLTFNASTKVALLYINGAQEVSHSAGSDTSAFTVWPGACSGVPAPQPFLGNLDAFGLWARTLSPAEITDLYNAGNGIEPY
jgi:hypothetical protein